MTKDNENKPSENEQLPDKEQTTDPERTIAEDEQISNTSGNISQRFEKVELVLKRLKGKRFGLGITLVHQRILVCKVEDDTLVFGTLRVGDQILEVDGQLVKEKSKCRKLLMSSLTKKGEVSVSIIRPKTLDAMSTIMEEMAMTQKPSVENVRVFSPINK